MVSLRYAMGLRLRSFVFITAVFFFFGFPSLAGFDDDANTSEVLNVGAAGSAVPCALAVALAGAKVAAPRPEIPLSYPGSRFSFHPDIVFKGEQSKVRVVWAPDGSFFALLESLGKNGNTSIRVFRVGETAPIYEVKATGLNEPIARFASDSKLLVVPQSNGLNVYSNENGKLISRSQLDSNPITGLSISNDGSRIVTAHYDKGTDAGQISLSLFHMNSPGATLVNERGYVLNSESLGEQIKGPPKAFTISRNNTDEALMVVGTKLVLQNLTSDRRFEAPRVYDIGRLGFDTAYVQGLALSPSGDLVAIKIGAENKVVFYSLSNRGIKNGHTAYLSTTNPAPTSLSFSYDGESLFVLDGGAFNKIEVVRVGELGWASTLINFGASTNLPPFSVLKIFP